MSGYTEEHLKQKLTEKLEATHVVSQDKEKIMLMYTFTVLSWVRDLHQLAADGAREE